MIVLDIAMPDLDGVTVTSRLRADGVDVPICVVSRATRSTTGSPASRRARTTTSSSPSRCQELVARLHALLRRRPETAERADSGRRPPHRPRPPAGASRYPTHRAHAARVRPARDIRPSPRPCSHARTIAHHRVGLRLRGRQQRRRRVRRLPAAQARNDGEPRLLHTVRGVGFVLRDDQSRARA